MWSLRTLFATSALALLVGGCASTKPAEKKEREALPDEEGGGGEWAPGKPASGKEGAGGGASSAEVGQAEIPSIKRKATARQLSEDQKAEFEKVVADYQKAKKGGVLGAGDCAQLASAFKRLADKNPSLLEARFNEAATYLDCNRKDEAVAIWNSMTAGQKPYAPALASLGYVTWQGGNKSAAETYFNRAVQADPLVGSIYARINLAQILRERARTVSDSEKKPLNDQAVRHLRTVLALDGNCLQAYAGLTYIYFDLGLPDAAKLVGAQAIKRAKEIATGKFEDESTAAEEVAKKGKKAAKGKKDKEETKGEPAAKSEEEDTSGTGYTTEMKKAVAVVYNTLGMISLSKKSYTEAIKNYTYAVSFDPTLYEARLNLAALSLKFRNYEIAEENLREVLKAQPRNYEAVIGLGVALRGNRKFEEAEAEYNRARQLDPQRSESYFNLGVLYQEYKGGSDKPMLQKAQGYYRDFLSRSQSQKMRKDAEKRIKDIDDTFAALKEAEQMMKEAEEMQRKAEAQQKAMEEQMKKQEADEKAKAEADKKKAEEDKIKAEEEKKKAEEDKIAAKAEAEKKKADEAAAKAEAAEKKKGGKGDSAAKAAAPAEGADKDEAAGVAAAAEDDAAKPAAAKPATDAKKKKK